MRQVIFQRTQEDWRSTRIYEARETSPIVNGTGQCIPCRKRARIVRAVKTRQTLRDEESHVNNRNGRVLH